MNNISSKKGCKVVCVIVTYNRLNLLKEAIAAVKAQTYPIQHLYIIDNCSDDGTEGYLSTFKDDSSMTIIRMDHNTGGAGGYAEGIKYAAKAEADWIWVMDDDTIPQPDALERLIPYTAIDNVGFLCSKVLWTDGQIHKMNIPDILEKQEEEKNDIFKDSALNTKECVAIRSASFVSLLLRSSIPWEIGLPYKEFFIWGDDAEYTARMYKAGYKALMVNDSIAIHKTMMNYEGSIYNVPASAAWKFYYAERNASFLRRQGKNKVYFFFSQLNAIRRHIRRIKKRHLPKNEEKSLLTACKKGLWDGLRFNPQIEHLK